MGKRLPFGGLESLASGLEILSKVFDVRIIKLLERKLFVIHAHSKAGGKVLVEECFAGGDVVWRRLPVCRLPKLWLRESSWQTKQLRTNFEVFISSPSPPAASLLTPLGYHLQRPAIMFSSYYSHSDYFNYFMQGMRLKHTRMLTLASIERLLPIHDDSHWDAAPILVPYGPLTTLQDHQYEKLVLALRYPSLLPC